MSGQDDDLITLEGGEPARRPGSEAQLAAALVMQAQALDGMRRAHAELLARIDQGPERQALLTALQELREASDRVQQEQARAARRLARARRRLAVLGVAVLLLGGAGVSVAAFSAFQVSTAWPAERQQLGAELAGHQQQWREALDQQAASLAELGERLDQRELALQGRLDDATTGRDEARRELEEARVQAAQLRVRQDELVADAARERDLRLVTMGETARLREQLMEGEQRMADLSRSLAELHAAPVPPPAPGIVTTAATAGRLARQATAALRASGAPDWSVIELGAVTEGVLQDLLVMQVDPEGGPGRVLRAGRGDLVAEGGRTSLRLTDILGADGQPLPPELLPLPALEREAWRVLGATVPGGAVAVSRLAAALQGLLEPHGWHVASLRGYDGQALIGLRLEQRDVNGAVTRVLRAEQGLVLPGPELQLTDGTLTVGRDERAFFGNVFRLPLPSGDFGAWLAAAQAEAP